MTGWEHRDELVRYVRRLLGVQAELAEDVVQEAYLRLHERAAAGTPVREPRPWLFRVARNLALDERRRHRRGDAAVSALGVVAPPSRGPLEVLQGREEARAALEGIESLPPNERRTMILEQAGLTPAAIARRVGTTTNAVHQSLFRARRRMRDARAAAWGVLPLPLVRLAMRLAASPSLEGLPALAPGAGGRMAGGAGLAGLAAAALVGGGVVADRVVVPHDPPPRPPARAASPSPAADPPAPAAPAAVARTVLADRSPLRRPAARVAPAATHAARRVRRDDAGDVAEARSAVTDGVSAADAAEARAPVVRAGADHEVADEHDRSISGTAPEAEHAPEPLQDAVAEPAPAPGEPEGE